MTIKEHTLLLDALDQLGIQQLRPQQEAPLEAICQGEDVLVVLPTGGGKSLLYQVPAIVRKGQLTLVVSPLKALQVDQVEWLTTKGVQAVLLNSDLGVAAHHAVLTQAVTQGGLLYLAPEQLQNERVRETLQQTDIACLVVDEAHILAQAQDDFRRAYGEIGELISSLPYRPQLLELTAAATRQD